MRTILIKDIVVSSLINFFVMISLSMMNRYNMDPQLSQQLEDDEAACFELQQQIEQMKFELASEYEQQDAIIHQYRSLSPSLRPLYTGEDHAQPRGSHNYQQVSHRNGMQKRPQR